MGTPSPHDEQRARCAEGSRRWFTGKLFRRSPRPHEKQGVHFWFDVVHNAPMNSPTAKNIRLTISVTPEVHETFQRLAKASSVSIGRSMGEWLGDTLEGVQYLALTLEKARSAPKAAIREMHSYALGLADETGAMMDQIRAKGVADRASVTAKAGARDRSAKLPSPVPPSCNTGGKVPQKGAKQNKDPK